MKSDMKNIQNTKTQHNKDEQHAEYCLSCRIKYTYSFLAQYYADLSQLAGANT